MSASDKINRLWVYFSNSFNRRENDLWAFTEWFGSRCGDNAAYFANYAAKNRPDLRLVWVAGKTADTSMLDPRIRVVPKESEEEVAVLKRAGVLVMNQGTNEFFESGLNYAGNALKVNLWHGVMWKKLGFDITGGITPKQRLSVALKDSYKRRYIFEAPSDEYRRILGSAFAIREREIVNAGQPRNALFFDRAAVRRAREKILDQVRALAGFTVSDDVRLITYMPTFRDKTSKTFNFETMAGKDDFARYLKDENVILIQKAHFVDAERKAGAEKSGSGGTSGSRILTHNDFISQELLAATDLLITDYSSCFFDFALLDRPVIHYIYDYDYYADRDRGLYYDWQEVVAGDAVFAERELAPLIRENLAHPERNAELRRRCRDRFMNYEGPDSCRIIMERIMSELG